MVWSAGIALRVSAIFAAALLDSRSCDLADRIAAAFAAFADLFMICFALFLSMLSFLIKVSFFSIASISFVVTKKISSNKLGGTSRHIPMN